MDQSDLESRRGRWFEATHWSVVLAAGQAEGAVRQKALETLCASYWEPVYTFLRHSGHGVADAQDLTQAFFAHLLGRNPFASLTPERGKFRSYLLKALKHFLGDERDRLQTAKRGGGQTIIPLDLGAGEPRYLVEATAQRPSDVLFDRRWALTLLNRAFQALQQELLAAGKAPQFAELSVFLAAEGNAAEYQAAATKLQMAPGAVAVAVHRLRQRYYQCIRAEIEHTVATDESVDQEMSYLLEVLCQ